MVNGLGIMLCHAFKEFVAEHYEAAATGNHDRIECGIDRFENAGTRYFQTEFGPFDLCERDFFLKLLYTRLTHVIEFAFIPKRPNRGDQRNNLEI